VSNLLIGLVGALMATNQPAAVSNLVLQTTGVSVDVAYTNDPIESALQKLSDDEAKARADVAKWVGENEALGTNGVPRTELYQKIQERFHSVNAGYDDLVKAHPDVTRVRLAYANYLASTGDEDGQQNQLEKALTLSTNNPETYNDLANIYGHHGPVTNAFAYYAKAIELNPSQPIYYENFATTVYLFRRDAMEFYGINEDQVFAKSFELYSNAMRLDPYNFDLAEDVARGYYGIRPMRTEPALKAFTNALTIAHTEDERQDVYLNLARIKIMAGRFDEAQLHLEAVTNARFTDIKRRVLRTLKEKQAASSGTNAVPSVPDKATPHEGL
jgi:tetratricopeptide (TPR) repeat protein